MLFISFGNFKDTLIEASSAASLSFSRLFEPLLPHLSSERLRKSVSKIYRNCLRFRQASSNQRILRHNRQLARLLAIGVLFIGWSPQGSLGKELFRHSTFQDFKKGNWSNAGQNGYVRSDGTLRLIHQFDFNNDGFADILVLNDHNHFDTPSAVLYRNEGEKGKEFTSLLPPLWTDMPAYEVFEHYVKVRDQQTFLPTIGGVAAAVGDFNGDGRPDIAISNIVHGWNLKTFPLSIYWGTKTGYRSEQRSLLDGYFASGIAASDVDRDGLTDLTIACRGPEYEVVANQKLPVKERREKASDNAKQSYLIFGAKQELGGRKQAFDTLYAIDVALRDINGDGKLDVIFLEAGNPGMVRIYLATEDGFAEEALEVEVGNVQWSVVHSRKMEVADLNDDKALDIIVPEASGLRILWNDGHGGFEADRHTMLDIKKSYASAVGDFNGDGKLDLAVAVNDAASKSAPSVILTNNGGPIETWKRTSVPSLAASAVTAADLNGDGYDDLVIANYQNSAEASLDTDSFIYWGSANGVTPYSRMDLATFGAVDVKTVPSTSRPGMLDLLFINRQSGRRGASSTAATDSGGMPTYVYWGNDAAIYSPAKMARFPASTSETSAVATDLTGDGNAELVLLTHRGYKAGIYKLHDGQYTLLRELSLPARGKAPVIADLDQDGKLDLLVVAANEPKALFYSDAANGSDKPITIALPQVGYSIALGDLDDDGYLDLVSVGMGHVFVVYGSQDGLDPNRTISFPQDKFFTKVALADLDGDGALDVVAFAWKEISTENNVTDSVIFWNHDGAISESKTSLLPTLGGAHQGTIADVNGDGFLDIISSNYHGGDDRHLDVQIFLGDGTRSYTRERSWTVPGFSSAANMVMDYNKDGFMDLLVFNHSESTEKVDGKLLGGMHSTGAWLYWGNQEGFSTERRSWIPTYGPHNKLGVDPGDIMRRTPVETFTSASIPLVNQNLTGSFFLEIKIKKVAAGSVKAHLLLQSGEGAGAWAKQSLPLASEKENVLTYGPITLQSGPTTPKIMKYQLEFNSELLGVAPVVEEVEGRFE